MSKYIAIYTRVSSKQQTHASQLPELQKWAASQDAEVRWFSDEFSGRTMNRPGWNRLETAIRAGEVSSVVVWRLDRLGRTAKGLTALFAELIDRKVNLVSLKDGIDLSTPAGRMMSHVLASIAQYETEIRGERVLAGQSAARAAGKRWGGGVAGRLIKVTPDQVEEIHRLNSEGSAIAKVARITGLSRPTVYRVLAIKERPSRLPSPSRPSLPPAPLRRVAGL